MAKGKQNNGKKGGRAKAPRKKQSVPRSVGSGLDVRGRAHAMLLQDPCRGPLLGTCFSGQAGYLTRFAVDIVVSTGATDQGAAVYWTPGFTAPVAVGNYGGIMVPTTPVTTDSAAITYAQYNAPGQAFLLANARSVRSVASCLQITYVGTETQRGGIVALGQADLGSLNTSPSTADLRGLAQKVCRMPNGTLEIKCVPNSASEAFTDPTVAIGAADVKQFEGLPSIFFSAFGFPVNTGMRVRFINVVEWLPNKGIGVPAPSATQSGSASTLNTVLAAMGRLGDWAYSGFEREASRMLPGIAAAGTRYAAMRAAPLLLGL